MTIELLVDMFDIARVLTNQHRSEILDRAHDRSRLPLERRLTPSEKPRLIGNDLDEDPVPHLRVDDNRLDIGDFHRGSDRNKAPKTFPRELRRTADPSASLGMTKGGCRSQTKLSPQPRWSETPFG